MHSQTHTPSDGPLAEYVTVMWEVHGAHNLKETILPSGIFEIIFNLGDEIFGFLPNGTGPVKAPDVFVQGLNTKAAHISFPGSQHLFGIRLKPHMIHELLGVMPSELNNTIIDLGLLNKEFYFILELLHTAKNFNERVRIIGDVFPIIRQTDCVRTLQLYELFMSDNIRDFQSMDELTRKVFYSQRHLNRKTQMLFGVSPEELITYKKFLYAVNRIHADETSLTQIAHDSGFYDQSHFSRVFKTYSGMTARQYKNQKSTLPFHLFDDQSGKNPA